VSLLLDALKRAEQEKLSRGAPSSGFETESPRMAPVSAAPLELQPVETQTAAHPGSGAADPRAAQNVFAAKTAAAAVPGMRRRAVLWAGLVLIVLVVLGAGGYVWYSIQALSPPALQARARPRPPAAPVPQPGSMEPSSASKMEALVAQAANNPPLAPASSSARAPAAPGTSSSPGAPEPAAAANGSTAALPSPPTSAQKSLAGLLRDNAAVPAQEPLTLQRSAAKPHVAPQVAAAYASLVSGDLERARRDYANALAEDASNIDALLGLATVEARLNHPALAAASYRKVLEVDPRNATALAGLAALPGGARGQGGESELRSALATQPESAPLHFTLGNLYISQGRWNEAQSEFFEAHRLDPANADVQFNLAVALDHIGQSRLAREFYERALDSASRQAVQFDATAVMRRLAELRQAARP
jgi:Tfp pilus assembly protein PilF